MAYRVKVVWVHNIVITISWKTVIDSLLGPSTGKGIISMQNELILLSGSPKC